MQMSQRAQLAARALATAEVAAYQQDIQRTAKIKRNDKLFAQ